MGRFKYVIITIVCLLGVYFFINSKKEHKSKLEEIEKAKIEIDSIKNESLIRSYKIDSIKSVNDSISSLIKDSEKEVKIITKEYEKKIINVSSVSIDSSISFVSKRLSEINLD